MHSMVRSRYTWSRKKLRNVHDGSRKMMKRASIYHQKYSRDFSKFSTRNGGKRRTRNMIYQLTEKPTSN